MQQAQVEFSADPARTNDLIVQAVQADNGSVWSYSPGLADYAVRTMGERGILGNGPTPTLGDLDPQRVTRMIEILTPVFAAQNAPVRPGLTAADLYTNDFVDPLDRTTADLTAISFRPRTGHMEDSVRGGKGK